MCPHASRGSIPKIVSGSFIIYIKSSSGGSHASTSPVSFCSRIMREISAHIGITTNICSQEKCHSPPDLHAFSGLNFASVVGAGVCLPHSSDSLLPPRNHTTPLRCDKDVAALVKRSRRLIREELRLETTNSVAEGGFKEIKTLPAFIRLVNNVSFKDLPQI